MIAQKFIDKTIFRGESVSECTSNEMRLRPLQFLPLCFSVVLHPNIDLLVVEAAHAGHGHTIRSWMSIPPYKVVEFFFADDDVVVLRDALVWTLGGGGARAEVDCVE